MYGTCCLELIGNCIQYEILGTQHKIKLGNELNKQILQPV